MYIVGVVLAQAPSQSDYADRGMARAYLAQGKLALTAHCDFLCLKMSALP